MQLVYPAQVNKEPTALGDVKVLWEWTQKSGLVQTEVQNSWESLLGGDI